MSKQGVPIDFDHDGFVVFWTRYPRKEAKVDAYKAWRQKRPSTETQALILIALAWQTTLWAKDGFRFVPLPGSYVRGERWTDERRGGEHHRAPQVGYRGLVPADEPL